MISGPICGAVSPTLQPPSSLGHRAVEPLRGVGVEGEQRLPRGDGLAGTAMDPQTCAGLHALARDAHGPRRAARLSVPPPLRRYRPWCHRAAPRWSRSSHRSQRLRQVAALGGDQARKWSIAEPSRSVCAGSTPSRPAASSISAASASVSSTTSAGRRRRALPATLPLRRRCRRSGRAAVHVGQQRAGRRPVRSAQLDHGARQLSGLGLGLQERPGADLGVEHQRPVPSAIFLLITELAISGSDSVVPVTSRSA